jgi:hypothetical protein
MFGGSAILASGDKLRHGASGGPRHCSTFGISLLWVAVLLVRMAVSQPCLPSVNPCAEAERLASRRDRGFGGFLEL